MEAPKPFELEYTPQFAELLTKLDISLVLSTYQAGKVVLISPYDNDRLIQLPRTFENAMGLAVKDDKLAVSAKKDLTVFKNNRQIAPLYPKKPNVYDAMFLPRLTYHTGYLALHDMAFIKNKLVAVNTMFSALAHFDDENNFTPFWQPPFISGLSPEDRCHLNGMAIENDEIKYLTALGKTDTPQGWRENKINGGILMEYPSGKIILEGLSMPHSPRIYNGKLYVLNSAQGELIEVNPQTGTYEVVVNLGGFARGMDIYGDYLFIGVSKLRHNSQVFRDLPIAKTSFAGVIVVYLPYKSVVTKVAYKMSVDEIYDVKVLAGMKRPNILSPDNKLLEGAIVVGDKYLWSMPENSDTQPQTQTTQAQQQANRIHYNILQHISSKDLVEQFEPLLCRHLVDKIKNKEIGGSFNVIVLSRLDKTPVAMTVFTAKQDRTAKIYSIFVRKEFRNNKLASEMLRILETISENNSFTYTEALFPQKFADSEILKKLFAKYPFINLVFD